MTANQPDTPDIPCACCLHTLDAVWQPPLYRGMTPYWLITCRTPGCALENYTFSSNEYPSEDMLERYGVAS